MGNKVRRLKSEGSFAGDIVLSLNENLDSFIGTLYDDEMPLILDWNKVPKDMFKKKESYARRIRNL